LTHRDYVTFNVDLRQMGLGGDTSWGAIPHQQFLIPAAAYQYTFRLRPFCEKQTPASVLGRQRME
jgi:beta-galactosidase